MLFSSQKRLTYEQQLLIAEDLYNETDRFDAARRLETECGLKIKKDRSTSLREFARALDKSRFLNQDIEAAIFKHSGYKVNLTSLKSGWF
ncbi:MAG TPA: hypothetical protein VJB39_01775 [Patescibacteria group bacterium]|nr:hypothetical protein [Patescibacteria group bacterium]